MRPALFHPKALEVLRSFPEDVRRAMGKAILDLQKGHTLSMPLSKAMPSVALGVEELRVHDAATQYRAFYYRKSPRGILVFHAFTKRTRKTAATEIALARRRLKEMLRAAK